MSCLSNYNNLLLCPACSLALLQAIMPTSTKEIFLKSKIDPMGKDEIPLPSKMLAPLSPLPSNHTKLPIISLMHLDVSCFSDFPPAVPAWNSSPLCLSAQHLLSFHDPARVFCSPRKAL